MPKRRISRTSGCSWTRSKFISFHCPSTRNGSQSFAAKGAQVERYTPPAAASQRAGFSVYLGHGKARPHPRICLAGSPFVGGRNAEPRSGACLSRLRGRALLCEPWKKNGILGCAHEPRSNGARDRTQSPEL